MHWDTVAVYATAWVALVAYVVSRGRSARAALLNLAGAWVLLLHAGVALFVVHDGSWSAARRHVIERTESLLGISFAWGFEINLLFVTGWMVDALVRIALRETWYWNLPRGYHAARRLACWGMLASSTVLFGSTAGQVAGVFLLVALARAEWRTVND